MILKPCKPCHKKKKKPPDGTQKLLEVLIMFNQKTEPVLTCNRLEWSNKVWKKKKNFDLEEEKPLWPHLQAVYEFLLIFVVSPKMSAKFAQQYMKIFELF